MLEKRDAQIMTNVPKGCQKGSRNRENINKNEGSKTHRNFVCLSIKNEPHPSLTTPGTHPRDPPPAPPESEGGGNRGASRKALSQPVDPSGVGGLF